MTTCVCGLNTNNMVTLKIRYTYSTQEMLLLDSL